MVKHHIASGSDAVRNHGLDIRLHNLVGIAKVFQIQMTGIPLSHPFGL